MYVSDFLGVCEYKCFSEYISYCCKIEIFLGSELEMTKSSRLTPSRWSSGRHFSFLTLETRFKSQVGQINISCHRLAFDATCFVQVAAMGSANSLHFTGTMTKMAAGSPNPPVNLW